MREMKTAARLILSAAVVLAAGGCAGPSLSYKKSLYTDMDRGDFAAAVKTIESEKASEYGSKNSLLYYLDLGMALHDAGRYEESDRVFDQAELRYDELYTKSVSRTLGTLMINDNTLPYAGHPFDKVLLHTFRALNYACRGDMEGALVEVRKQNLFLRTLGDSGAAGYKDDAFAEYLGGLMYEDEGKTDDARISFAAAAKAYGVYKKDFGMVPPDFGAAVSTPGWGEVIFLHYNGKAPVLVSKTIQVAWNDALVAINSSPKSDEESARFANALRAGVYTNAVTVALPELRRVDYAITGSEVFVESATWPTVQAENVGALVKQEFKRSLPGAALRASARAIFKYVTTNAISKSAEDKGGSGLGLLAKIAASAVSAATEVADTRTWATVPDEIRVARIALPAGVHNLHVSFTTAGGVAYSDVIKDIKVEAGHKTFVHRRTAR
ncbi:MAG: hypothetical protein PHW69_05175 [Elusimicrobiaceae bacterium]|nr:hypothetical protein [Elusimicrobiaceae bacterium]